MNDQIVLPAALALISSVKKDIDNTVLLTRRKQLDKFAEPSWSLPGGAVNDGETPLEALKRELNEELKVVKFEVINQCTLTQRFNQQIFEYHIYHVLVRQNADILLLDEDADELKWFRNSDLQSTKVFQNVLKSIKIFEVFSSW